LDEAAAHYASAIALQPGFAAAHENLGVVYLMTGHFPESEQQLKESLRLQPGNIGAHFNLAQIQTQLGETAEAIENYRAVLRLDPQENQARQKLAWLLATGPNPRLRDGAEALRLATQVTQSAPSDPVTWDTQAAALAETGRYIDAAAAATKALDLAATSQKELTQQIEARLRLYKSGTPFVVDNAPNAAEVYDFKLRPGGPDDGRLPGRAQNPAASAGCSQCAGAIG
jgi:tetratricopeptide (TPR) repeat protein